MKKLFLIFSIAIFMLLATSCGDDRLSEPENTALQFYKALWVEGNLEKAKSFIGSYPPGKKLNWRAEEAKKDSGADNKILIAESPLDVQKPNEKSYLIHRSSDKKDFKVTVRQINGKWKVINFHQTYRSDAGGYNSFENYQRIKYEFPKMKWKEITP